jgi:hypothetical protein
METLTTPLVQQMSFFSKWLTVVVLFVAGLLKYDFGLTHEDPRFILIDGLKREKYKGMIAVSTQHSHDINALQTKGADLVFLPFHDAAGRTVERIRMTSL